MQTGRPKVDEYDPAGHLLHEREELAPTLVDQEPTAQRMQASKDVAISDDDQVPGSHSIQLAAPEIDENVPS